VKMVLILLQCWIQRFCSIQDQMTYSTCSTQWVVWCEITLWHMLSHPLICFSLMLWCLSTKDLLSKRRLENYLGLQSDSDRSLWVFCCSNEFRVCHLRVKC
jgi:hypothetical protein